MEGRPFIRTDTHSHSLPSGNPLGGDRDAAQQFRESPPVCFYSGLAACPKTEEMKGTGIVHDEGGLPGRKKTPGQGSNVDRALDFQIDTNTGSGNGNSNRFSRMSDAEIILISRKVRFAVGVQSQSYVLGSETQDVGKHSTHQSARRQETSGRHAFHPGGPFTLIVGNRHFREIVQTSRYQQDAIPVAKVRKIP